MVDHPDKELSRDDQKRLQPFLDCVAYLLAKQWLQDQRRREETQQKDGQKPSEEVAEQ